MNGFIFLFRRLMEWEWYTDSPTKDLFIHCLLKANYEDIWYRGEIIKRGSFVTSYAKLASELGLSIKKIRRALDNLESTNDITTKRAHLGTLINVVNYGVYQQSNEQAGHTKGTPKGTQRARSNKIINKEDYDNDNDNSAEALFEEHNFFTNKLLKDGFISQKEELYSYDSLFEDLLKTENFIDVAKAVEYIKGKMKNKEIKNKFGYFKTAVQNQLEYVPEMTQDQTRDILPQVKEEISDEELREILKSI